MTNFFSFSRRPKTTVAAVILFLILGWIVYANYIAEPKPKSEKKEDLVAFLASPEFKKLSLEKQRYYASKLRGKPGERPNFRQMRQNMEKLSESERHTVFENMHRAERIARDKEALAYVKMSRAERDAFLDKRIEEMDKRFAEMEKRRQSGQEPRPRPTQQQTQQNGQRQEQKKTEEQRRNEFAARMKSNMENTPPEVRAARSIMMREMMERRKATGKSMPKPPGGGRGGPPPPM